MDPEPWLVKAVFGVLVCLFAGRRSLRLAVGPHTE
jgi:hypothetical protein